VSRNGERIQPESMDVLFDSHFIRSHIMVAHIHRVYGVIDLMAELGGLLSAIISIIGLLAYRVNREFLLNKIIRAMYFVKSNVHDNDEKKETNVDYDDNVSCGSEIF